MLFKPEMIEQIITGKKTMTRRIVKKEEEVFYEPVDCGTYTRNNNTILEVFTGMGRTKWRVGKKYAVCPGRGKPQVYWCPDCKKIDSTEGYVHESKPLFIELVSIKKQKLLSTSEEDAKREGFKDRACFLNAFARINKKVNMNCEVWALSFKVVK